MNFVVGTDVSFYDDLPETPQGIDYIKMRQKADFVIIRAGQNVWIDPTFETNWAASKAAGMPRGSYWFYDSRVDPKQQAELYTHIHGNDLGELPLFADFEDNYKGPYANWRNWVNFLERLKQLIGNKEIGIYTAYYYWRSNTPSALLQPADLDYFKQYPLWIANYEVAVPKIPKPWGNDEWLFWQFTESGDGQAYGAESKGIDVNYFNGDREAFQKRFNLTLTAPQPNEPMTLDLTGIKYKVNTAVLNVRSGPRITYEKIGTLELDEIVDAIEAVEDKSWIRVRNSNNLTGWCFSQYLTQVSEPLSPPDTGNEAIWAKVTTAVLYVREGPSTSTEVIGKLSQDDIILALAESVDKSWVQIKRFDGLVGWSSKRYLMDLGCLTPTHIKQTLFGSVIYYRKEQTQPRTIISHVLRIDLKNGGIKFFVTPPLRDSGPPLCTLKTSEFLSRFNLQTAVNGDGFYYPNPTTYSPQQYCPKGGDPLWPNGLAASRGRQYSKRKAGVPVLYISASNQITFNQVKGRIYNAISGDRMLVDKGKIISGLENTSMEPRTAVGINQNGRWLVLIVVDGRGQSTGVTFSELANLLLSYGVYTGMSLDGGGSSTMVIQGAEKKPIILNIPVDDNTVGKERAVANHLGIYVKK